MIFVDCRLTGRKGGEASKTKLRVKENELLLNVAKTAIAKFATNKGAADETELASKLLSAFNRIKTVPRNESDLTDFVIDDPTATIIVMDSTETPIFTNGINFLLSPIEPGKGDEESTANPTKGKDVLKRRANGKCCVMFGVSKTGNEPWC